MSDAIALSGVTKVFYPHRRLNVGLKEVALHPLRVLRQTRASRFVALEDVSLSVPQGEIHGIIGRNGAGKSTLLGLIGGVLQPTAGRIEVRGRISPLLELGVGFVYELTARENVVLNGVLLGMRRREIEARLDQVIEFAGLAEFEDQQLKTFSSGMMSRLGFAVAVHADPQVLLVDEVLAVGDLEFQQRCLDRISSLRREGATVLFVSHDMKTVADVCDRATWLEHGRVERTGPPKEVAALYEERVEAESRRARPSLGDGLRA